MGTVVEGEVLAKPVNVGDSLRNGATVLAVKPYVPSNATEGVIVLALANKREFVTWVCESDGREAFWGHYFFTDLVAALRDFEARR